MFREKIGSVVLRIHFDARIDVYLLSTAVLTGIVSQCVLSPPDPLRCRMCLAESESISRRTETL